MRTSASPGSRLVVGDSGVVFEVAASVASGLVANGSARYADEATPIVESPRPVPADDQAGGTDGTPAPRRRGRPPKQESDPS